MMDPAVKTAMALCVLLGGVCAALLFRSDRSQSATPTAGVDNKILLRYRTDTSGSSRQSGANPAIGTSSAMPERPATVVIPLDRHEPPPALSPDYPETKQPPSSHWGLPMGRMLPVAAMSDQAARTHRVVDGDTLESLAERYLGASARAEEIQAVNRDLLPDPKLLPIGVELRIPPMTSK
jgi:hypothetical protein